MEPNFTQYTPKGIEILVYKDKPYTPEELLLIEQECEQDYREQQDEDYQEYQEDPDADGYGWERRALARLG